MNFGGKPSGITLVFGRKALVLRDNVKIRVHALKGGSTHRHKKGDIASYKSTHPKVATYTRR